jgi:4-amino-4-deoxy-L-arabinose transferase-like glycosyltransferase
VLLQRDLNPPGMQIMKSKKTWHFLRPPAVIGLILIIAGLYWYGAVEQLTRVNTNMNSTDQRAYMNYARSLYKSNYTFIGGRNRMPVYPFLQSLFYRPDMTDEAFFTRGKYINLVLSLGLLAGLEFVFRRFFSWLHSLNLLLIVAFTVFIFKAGYFQVELLFYFVNFCLFLLMWRLLQRMSWRLAILTGIVAGLAHLTKASILPGLAIFLVLAGVKWGWVTLRSRHSSGDAIPAKFILSHLLAVLLVGAFFLITVFPYINTSKRVFGHYFYNVNSTFYIWYDSWEEAKQGTRAHGDRVGWPDMPPEGIPSMSKYLREHTLQQIIGRFVDGGQRVLYNVVHSYGYFKYIVVYLCLLIIAILRFWRRVRQAVMSNPILYLFLVIYFAGYLLLYFWYVPIAGGDRLILAQFIPLMFTVSNGLHTLLLSSRLKIRGHSVHTLVISNLAILLIVIADIYFVLTERVGTMYGGE